jgi:hypothetical protein
MVILVCSATRPTVAAGIVLTTVAGLLGATRFWANGAMDSAVKWAAVQIEENRFGFIGFFDGSFRSFAVSLSWCCTVAFSPAARVDRVFDWMFPALAAPTAWGGGVLFLLAMSAFGARTILLGVDTPPDGVVFRTVGDWLTARQWFWPMAGLVLSAGVLLLVTAS